MTQTDKLRFAPIIRVSTEQQKDRRTSLTVQRKQITQYVKMMDCTVPPDCWKYSGQEHATPEYERKKLDELLRDATKDKFDAVIVADASRWSRDNLRSKEGLEILKQNGIRFFVGTMEFDLWNPQHSLILGITTEINEWQAKTQTLKSIQSRIQSLADGKPSAGKKPFGRTWTEQDGWGIDPDKQRIAEQAARRYLDGESMKQIAQSYGINPSGLMRTLKNSCGDTWEVSFNVPKLNISTSVKVEVPRLLPEETIQAIHRKAEKNKTYHGPRIAKYLLSKYVYCAECGYNMHSSTNRSKKTQTRYYRHATHGNARKCKHRGHIRSTELETLVLTRLKTVFGNPEKVRQAIARANPDPEGTARLEAEKQTLENQITKLERQRDNIVDKVAEGLLSDADIKTKMEKLREQLGAKQTRLQAVADQLNTLPSVESTKRLSELAAKVLSNATRSPRLDKMKFHEARKLVEQAFDGKDQQGNPFGVYVKWDADKDHQIELRGVVERTLLAFPMDDQALAELYDLDSEYVDISTELAKIKKTINENSLY